MSSARKLIGDHFLPLWISCGFGGPCGIILYTYSGIQWQHRVYNSYLFIPIWHQYFLHTRSLKPALWTCLL